MFRPALSALALSATLLACSLQAYAPAKRAAAPTTSPFAAHINALRNIRQVLNDRPNHNYGGHRVKAIHEITQAIHTLRGQTAANTPKGKGKGKGVAKANKAAAKVAKAGKGNPIREPQALSDQQLRDAAAQLAVIQKQVGAADGGHIANAIRELGLALMVN